MSAEQVEQDIRRLAISGKRKGGRYMSARPEQKDDDKPWYHRTMLQEKMAHAASHNFQKLLEYLEKTIRCRSTYGDTSLTIEVTPEFRLSYKGVFKMANWARPDFDERFFRHFESLGYEVRVQTGQDAPMKLEFRWDMADIQAPEEAGYTAKQAQMAVTTYYNEHMQRLISLLEQETDKCASEGFSELHVHLWARGQESSCSSRCDKSAPKYVLYHGQHGCLFKEKKGTKHKYVGYTWKDPKYADIFNDYFTDKMLDIRYYNGHIILCWE